MKKKTANEKASKVDNIEKIKKKADTSDFIRFKDFFRKSKLWQVKLLLSSCDYETVGCLIPTVKNKTRPTTAPSSFLVKMQMGITCDIQALPAHKSVHKLMF